MVMSLSRRKGREGCRSVTDLVLEHNRRNGGSPKLRGFPVLSRLMMCRRGGVGRKRSACSVCGHVSLASEQFEEQERERERARAL